MPSIFFIYAHNPNYTEDNYNVANIALGQHLSFPWVLFHIKCLVRHSLFWYRELKIDSKKYDLKSFHYGFIKHLKLLIPLWTSERTSWILGGIYPWISELDPRCSIVLCFANKPTQANFKANFKSSNFNYCSGISVGQLLTLPPWFKPTGPLDPPIKSSYIWKSGHHRSFLGCREHKEGLHWLI